MALHSSFKIGGKAEYFLQAESKEELLKAIQWAKEKKLPCFVFGGGSNILFPDKGCKGLIIKICNIGFEIEGGKCRFLDCDVRVQAGNKLSELVDFATKNSLSGLEWAAGIPGTAGGAIYGNAQAFGSKMADLIVSVEALNSKTMRIKSFAKEECRFKSKNSLFKKNKNLVVLSAVLKLNKGEKGNIERKIKEILSYRKERHPDLPSAGSVFINREKPVSDKKLLKEFPELAVFNERKNIPSAFLIEKCGLKGKRIGKAMISEKHANFIVNLGGAKAKDVLALISLAKKRVKEKFKISLEEEIQIVK